MGLYTLFFEDRVRSRLQLPERKSQFRKIFVLITNVTSGTIHLSQVSFWKPRYIPSANSLDIPHHELETLKVENSNGIEAHVEQNQGPLKEGVSGIS